MRDLVKSVKNQKVTAILSDIKQRLPALFFVALMISGLCASPAFAIADSISANNSPSISALQSPAYVNAPTTTNIANRTPPAQKTSTTPSVGTINTNSAPAPVTQQSPYKAATNTDNMAVGGGASSFLASLKGSPNNQPLGNSSGSQVSYQPHELTNLRTATSSTYLNANGTVTKTAYFAPHFYNNNGAWNNIDTSLIPDDNAADSGNVLGKALGVVESWLTSNPTAFVEKANSWQARFTPSDFPLGMVRIKDGTSQVGFSPLNANSVIPVISKAPDGNEIVKYSNLWNGVDVEYLVESDQVKEAISLDSNTSPSQVQFKIIGGDLQKPTSTTKDQILSAFNITGALGNNFDITPANLILNSSGLDEDSDTGLLQTYSNGVLTVGLNSSYLQSLPSSAFPAVIDPTVKTGTIGDRTSGTYVSFETNGTVCQSNVCDPYAGYLTDNHGNVQDWRTAIYAPYSELATPGTQLTNADLHLTQLTGVSWFTGTTATHNYQVGNATCLSTYQCMDADWDNSNVGTSGDINVTNIYQNLMNNGNWNGYLMVDQNDGSTTNFKAFDPDPTDTYVTFTYNNAIPAPTFITPTNNQIFTSAEASFSLNSESNPNDGTLLQYEMMVSDSPGGTGTVMDSGTPQNSTLWTVPNGVLEDGSTYYIQARSYDSSTQLYSPWSGSVEFQVNSDNGQSKTQTYDTAGPASVDLATGNLETSVASHTTTALAGDIGLNLDYNSPLKSSPGLVGSYWNLASGGTGIPATTPTLQRVDQNVNFNWSTGSPSNGIINTTYFAAQWNGYFVAPTSGSYNFGALHDASLSILVNGSQVYNLSSCTSGPCYGSAVSLTAGQVVPIQVSYDHATGAANAELYVEGAVSSQLIPAAWLQSGMQPVESSNGLVGHYFSYTDTGNPPAVPN
jgi:hypothetical protein